MITPWNEFIHQKDLALVNGTLPDTETWLCPLPHYSLIIVSGEESFTFLNNNLTNDFNKVSENISQLNAYCNSKGRVFCCCRVFRRDGCYYLRIIEELEENILKRFQTYILRTKVALKLSDWGGIGLAGNRSGELIQSLDVNLESALDQPNAVIHTDKFSILCLPSHQAQYPRYEIYAAPEQLKMLWTHLAEQTQPVTTANWRLLAINAGEPEIYPATSEHFVPQMLNLDLLQGISFSKGCYPGQEIVARTHYRGKLKRRMYGFSANSELIPPATPIFAPTHSEQPIGEVVDACALNTQTLKGLAVLRIDAAEDFSDALTLQTSQGCTLKIENLPYDVVTDSLDPEK